MYQEEKDWKIDKNVYNDMCQVDILENEKLNEVIQECLTNGNVSFLHTTKKNWNWIRKKSHKVKLFQLFKKIAKDLDLSLTYPWTLRKLFDFLLSL